MIDIQAKPQFKIGAIKMKNNIIGTIVTTILTVLMVIGLGGRILQHTESFSATINQQISSIGTTHSDESLNQTITKLEANHGKLQEQPIGKNTILTNRI